MEKLSVLRGINCSNKVGRTWKMKEVVVQDLTETTKVLK
jgi:hypothetical protein